MRHRLIFDRFEGESAVLIDDAKKSVVVKRSSLPDGLSEGASLIEENGAYLPDPADTEKRRREIEKKTKRLFE